MPFLERWERPQYLAFVPALCGVAIFCRCIWIFAVVGHGTPAPVDLPKVLVVCGLYRYARNPMYLGVLLFLLAESAFFESWSLLKYVAGIFICFHLFIVLYEEPSLRRRFGESYVRYCRSVHRWLPGKKYQGTD